MSFSSSQLVIIGHRAAVRIADHIHFLFLSASGGDCFELLPKSELAQLLSALPGLQMSRRWASLAFIPSYSFR
ncbi:MAG: hypothetical protein ACK546_00530 [bacterium]